MLNDKTSVLMVFHSLPQAKIIEGLLASNGIACFLSNESGAVLNPIFEPDNTSIRLHVRESDIVVAKEILMGAWRSEEINESGEEPDEVI
jgi:hypothetical protein